MRSWYLVMSLFLGVCILLACLLSLFNNGCTTICASSVRSEHSYGYTISCKNGANALPWQLDAVSIGSAHIPAENKVPPVSEVQELSCAGRTNTVKSLFSREG
jgi:hypothetical protein